MNSAFQKARGVTMIELVVVMVIIAIIASLGVPAFRKNIQRARSRDAIANVRIIHDANQLRLARSQASFSCAVPTACTLAEINSINGAHSLYVVSQGAVFSIVGGTSLEATDNNGDFVACVDLTSPTAVPSCRELTAGACASSVGTCP